MMHTRATAGLVCAGAGAALLRRRSFRWGAAGEEPSERLPGDELVPDPDLEATRAVTVRCGAHDVWPWIAQLGQGRGGFYTYDVLENLLGCDMHSASRIVPEWQTVDVGGEVKLHPDGGLSVAVAEPGRALVLQGGMAMGATPAPYNFSWAFVLRPQSDGSTRLLIRKRYAYLRWWAPLLLEPVELVSFVMSRRMLLGIKDRAERASRLALFAEPPTAHEPVPAISCQAS